MKESLIYFLFTFTSLFTIVNPFGSMSVYLAFTDCIPRARAKRMARNACITAFVVMIGFGLASRFLFSFFNISVDGLRIVGGVIFFIIGYDMLQGKMARTKVLSKTDTLEADEVAITPLAIPMICGPGAITVTTVLFQEAETMLQKSLLLCSILIVCILTFFFLISAKKIMGLFGNSGNKVFFRLMGLIIMMIAVEFFFSGLKPYVQGLLKP